MIDGFVVIAEGVASDADGVLSAIGLGQNTLAATTLPANTKRAVILYVRDTEVPGGDVVGEKIEFSFSLKNEAGEVVMAQSGGGDLGTAKFPYLPWGVVIPAETFLSLKNYGTYTFEVNVQFRDEAKSFLVPFYVVDPRGAEQADVAIANAE